VRTLAYWFKTVVPESVIIDLTHNTQLRELSLPAFVERRRELPFKLRLFPPEWQSAMLATISSSSLHTIRMNPASWDPDIVVCALDIPNLRIEELDF
jgi:hypothetical protein